ncbi:MAG TPA: hypothetical protein VMH27_09510 [Puia sp.]|nr:hypothetical protein [Puia sp.]
MDNQAEPLTPEESLLVIRSMIEKTKTSVADNSFYFLLWGWLVFIAALLQYILVVYVRTPLNGMAWNLMFIGFIVSIIRGARARPKRVRTYVDEGLRHIWECVVILQIVIVLIYFKRGDWEHCYVFFILSYSIGCFLTGRLLRFAPLVWGAFACWAIAVLMTYTDTPTNMLLTAAAVLASYIVPGYLLRAQYKHQLQKK